MLPSKMWHWFTAAPHPTTHHDSVSLGPEGSFKKQNKFSLEAFKGFPTHIEKKIPMPCHEVKCLICPGFYLILPLFLLHIFSHSFYNNHTQFLPVSQTNWASFFTRPLHFSVLISQALGMDTSQRSRRAQKSFFQKKSLLIILFNIETP